MWWTEAWWRRGTPSGGMSASVLQRLQVQELQALLGRAPAGREASAPAGRGRYRPHGDLPRMYEVVLGGHEGGDSETLACLVRSPRHAAAACLCPTLQASALFTTAMPTNTAGHMRNPACTVRACQVPVAGANGRAPKAAAALKSLQDAHQCAAGAAYPIDSLISAFGSWFHLFSLPRPVAVRSHRHVRVLTRRTTNGNQTNTC